MSNIPQPKFVFIDRRTFSDVKSKGVTNENIVSMITQGINGFDVLSATTQLYLQTLNKKLNDLVLRNDQWLPYSPNLNLNSKEYRYAEDLTMENMTQTPEAEVLFEIHPVDHCVFIVVVEKGFLSHLTSIKSNLKGFVLACLRSAHTFKCDLSQLFKTYLNYEFSDHFFKLLVVRVG